jgi:hypothetical protein
MSEQNIVYKLTDQDMQSCHPRSYGSGVRVYQWALNEWLQISKFKVRRVTRGEDWPQTVAETVVAVRNAWRRRMQRVTRAEEEAAADAKANWFCVYSHPLLAVLLTPEIRNPRLFEAEWRGERAKDSGFGLYGLRNEVKVKELRLLKELPLPKITFDQKVAFGIYCALEVYSDKDFNNWAKKWLSGEDRTRDAAHEAGDAAFWKKEVGRAAEWAAEAARAAADAAKAAWTVRQGSAYWLAVTRAEGNAAQAAAEALVAVWDAHWAAWTQYAQDHLTDAERGRIVIAGEVREKMGQIKAMVASAAIAAATMNKEIDLVALAQKAIEIK